jgi:hypothetical protein
MARNAEIEVRWVNAWSELFELIKGRHGIRCQLPDFSVVTVQECQAWLQESVYAGYFVQVELGWIQGRPGIIASRNRTTDYAS